MVPCHREHSVANVAKSVKICMYCINYISPLSPSSSHSTHPHIHTHTHTHTHQLEQTHDLSSLDIQTVLLDMRRQRLGLIQTPDQLRFSYIAILQGAMQILGIENTNYTEELSESESESEELVESEGKWVGMWGLVSTWASWWVEEG